MISKPRIEQFSLFVKKSKMNRNWELFSTFFTLGLFTIGGGLAMLPLIRSIVVDKKQWMTQEECVDCFSVCQALPGVIAVNVAIFIGRKIKGFSGAVCATLGVVFPSFFIIILLVLFLNNIQDNPHVTGAFEGIKAAAAGLIAVAAYELGKKTINTIFGWVVALAAFGSVVFLGFNAVWIILVGAILGYASYFIKNWRNKGRDIE